MSVPGLKVPDSLGGRAVAHCGEGRSDRTSELA